jgi:hypothetical protein
MAQYNPPDQQQYPPPQQPYYPQGQQQYTYNSQQQPAYNPNTQQQWGLHQDPQHQYFGAPSGIPQGQPITGVVPPAYETAPYDGTVNPESGLPAKFNPRPRYNDCWAFFLFIAQLAAFVVLSGFAINKLNENRQMGSGYYPPGQQTPGAPLGFFSKSGLIAMLIAVLTGAVVSVLYFMLTEA